MYYASAKEMELMDKLAVENGLKIIQMMELAGWHMVKLFKLMKIWNDKKIFIACGNGNNGGDGLSAARHLKNHGYEVHVSLMSKDIKDDPLHQLRLLEKMEVDIHYYSDDPSECCRVMQNSDVVIDALLGYSVQGNPKDGFDEAILAINNLENTVISYDNPSGLDVTTGECHEPCIVADATLALALPKKCFNVPTCSDSVGEIFIADIGIPAFIYNEIEAGSRPPFLNNGVLALDT